MSLNARIPTLGHVRPAKVPVSLCIRAVCKESSLGAFWIAKDAKFLHADAQADLSLRWAHREDGAFSELSSYSSPLYQDIFPLRNYVIFPRNYLKIDSDM